MGTGPCVIPSANNAQLLITIDKNTALGSTLLKNVTYGSTVETTPNLQLSSFLYGENVIDFMNYPTNTILTFMFDGILVHKKLIVRAKVLTTCTGSQNKTITMTLSGQTPVIITQALTSNA